MPLRESGAGKVSRTIGTARHEALRLYLIEMRKKAGMTQAELAGKLDRYQSFVATFESGQRRIDAVELVQFAEAIGFDPCKAIRHIQKTAE